MSRIRSSPRRRWQQWQQSLVSQRYLTPDGARHGYTLVKVPAASQEVFFVLATLLQAQARLDSSRAALHADAQTAGLVREAEAALVAWQRWTRQLTGYLGRVTQGLPATLPPLPLGLLGEEVAP
jgi:hypothetical protein